MKPSSVILPAVKRASGRRRPSRSSTGPSGAGMIALQRVASRRRRHEVHRDRGRQAVVRSCAAPPAPATAASAAAREDRQDAREPRLSGAPRCGPDPYAAFIALEPSFMWCARPSFSLVKSDLERGRRGPCRPSGSARTNCSSSAPALVPVGQQRRGDVDTRAVPALRDHVDLLAGDPLVGLACGCSGFDQVEVARLAVHERC